MKIDSRICDSPLMLCNHTAYKAGSVLHGLLDFEVGPGVFALRQLVLTDKSTFLSPHVEYPFKLCHALNLYLFDRMPVTIDDGQPFAPNWADVCVMVGQVSIMPSDYHTIDIEGELVGCVTKSFSPYSNDTMYIDARHGRIYGYLVCKNAAQYADMQDLHLSTIFTLVG